MPYKMNKAQLRQVLSLPADQRYAHFMAKVADWEELWTLRGPDGFVMFGDDEARECVPVWSHPDYAAASATDSWASCVPERLDLDAFRTKWLPGMAREMRTVRYEPEPVDFDGIRNPQGVDKLETAFCSVENLAGILTPGSGVI